MGKTFSNEELVIKIVKCLNCSWQPKVIAIGESKDLEAMDKHTLFGKLHEHEMKLKRLPIYEKGGNKNKSP